MSRPICRLAGWSLADWLLALAGVSLFWFTIAYPFGNDQGLYFYVGREWLHGRLPYRDLIEQKTPPIYLVHGLLILLTGQNQWAIRVLELLTMPVIGTLAARLMEGRREPLPGLAGLCTLFTAIWYFGYLSFWDTAQCEIWVVLFGLAAIAVAARPGRGARKAWMSGLWAGIAVLFKPPGLPFAVVALLVLLLAIARAGGKRRDLGAAIARFSAAGASVFALTIGYFAARGGLAAMYDVLVRANRYYVTHDRNARSLRDVVVRSGSIFVYYAPLSMALLVVFAAGLAVAIARRQRAAVERYLIAAALGAGGYLGYVIQMKFYLYHTGLFMAGATTLVAAAALHARELLGERVRARSLALAAVLIVGLFGLSSQAKEVAKRDSNTVHLLTHRMSREQFTATFSFPHMYYFYHDIERVGRWLRTSSSPSDNILVRGFNPQIYEIAHRRYTGRFFWTPFLADPHRAYRRAEWLAEDHQDIVRDPPRYIVTLSAFHTGIDSSDVYFPLGYYVTRHFGMLDVLAKHATERDP